MFPKDIKLLLPQTDLPKDQQHFLLYVPWEEKYLQFIPAEFKSYFIDCLPQLSVRTTDVHVAFCFQYFNQLISDYEKHQHQNVNRRVLGLALILHDIGWNRLSQAEIAASLGITGLALNPKAIGPKEKHAIEGGIIARKKLNRWNLPESEINLICQCVRWHDQPQKVASGSMPTEVQLLVDLDHIWAFTRLNFWQDTKRKGVKPTDYLRNLSTDLDNFFVTSEGKTLAKELLREREKEVRS